MRSWSFAKGHGTGNDFVLVLDRHGMDDPAPEEVRALCDRHTGVGADGLIRVVRGANVPEWEGAGDVWFMDYRNADGSLAEMCGNGVRVFVRYLLEEGLVNGPEVMVGSRAGARPASVQPDGSVLVGMGPVRVGPAAATVGLAERRWDATVVDVGNPHAVSFLDDVDEVDALVLADHHVPSEVFPDGVNLEFVAVLADRDGVGHVHMRVLERGSGETLSCGTGTVAVAAAAAHRRGAGAPRRWRVDVPGGSVWVDLDHSSGSSLCGPAVIVAHGEAQPQP